MNERTVRALNAINRSFYRDAASDFSATRQEPWPGWERLPPLVEAHLPGRALRVADVGCGNGRFAEFLAEALPTRLASLHYLGIDASTALLAAVHARHLPFAKVETDCADLVEAPLEQSLGGRTFSLIAVIGFLHHVPGEARRRQLLESPAARLEPGGLLVLAFWRFQAFARFRDKLRPWEEWNAAASEPIDLGELEDGDHLLPWGPEARAFRYCHFADEAETRRLVAAARLAVVATYTADGREGDLNRYFLLRRGDGS